MKRTATLRRRKRIRAVSAKRARVNDFRRRFVREQLARLREAMAMIARAIASSPTFELRDCVRDGLRAAAINSPRDGTALREAIERATAPLRDALRELSDRVPGEYPCAVCRRPCYESDLAGDSYLCSRCCPHPAEETVDEAEGAWVIMYDDASVSPEVFVGEGARQGAYTRYRVARESWSCHLFERVFDALEDEEQTLPVVEKEVTKLPAKLGKATTRPVVGIVDDSADIDF